VWGRSGDEVSPTRTGPDAREQAPGVDLDATQPRGVDEDSPVSGSGGAVARGHHADAQSRGSREPDSVADVVLVLGQHHGRGAVMGVEVPGAAGSVEVLVAGREQPAGNGVGGGHEVVSLSWRWAGRWRTCRPNIRALAAT
jgi:hypothetical protein